MALPVYRYPLDPTGTNPDNLVVREPHQLNKKTDPTFVRVACPLYGPFFAESVIILDASNGRQLVKDIDYKTTDLLQDPTLSFGKEISQFIVITNGEVSDEIEISYQVLGGNYQNNATAVQHVFETFLNDDRTVDWSNVGNKPATYPPSLHLHLLQDIINFGPLVVAINSLRDAKMLNNTPMFEALVQWVKARKVDWFEITNRPNSLEAAGFPDAVTTNTKQTITAHKDFNTVHLGKGSTAVSAFDGLTSEIATINDIRDVQNGGVPSQRKIVTGDNSGLRGGGTLERDITLSLTVTGVEPGIYGNSSQIPIIQVDNQGRITYATTTGFNLDFNSIVNLPSTLEGYGIDDAVDISSSQEITGYKQFKLLKIGEGSTSADIDIPEEYSGIVTEGFLGRKRLLDEVSEQTITGLKTFINVILGKDSTAGNIHNGNFSKIVTKDYLDLIVSELEQKIVSSGSPSVVRDVTGQRASGSWYINNSGGPMIVAVTSGYSEHQTGCSIHMNGQFIYASEADQISGRSGVSLLIPNGSSYMVSSGPGISKFIEITVT